MRWPQRDFRAPPTLWLCLPGRTERGWGVGSGFGGRAFTPLQATAPWPRRVQRGTLWPHREEEVCTHLVTPGKAGGQPKAHSSYSLWSGQRARTDCQSVRRPSEQRRGLGLGRTSQGEAPWREDQRRPRGEVALRPRQQPQACKGEGSPCLTPSPASPGPS